MAVNIQHNSAVAAHQVLVKDCRRGSTRGYPYQYQIIDENGEERWWSLKEVLEQWDVAWLAVAHRQKPNWPCPAAVQRHINASEATTASAGAAAVDGSSADDADTVEEEMVELHEDVNKHSGQGSFSSSKATIAPTPDSSTLAAADATIPCPPPLPILPYSAPPPRHTVDWTKPQSKWLGMTSSGTDQTFSFSQRHQQNRPAVADRLQSPEFGSRSGATNWASSPASFDCNASNSTAAKYGSSQENLEDENETKTGTGADSRTTITRMFKDQHPPRSGTKNIRHADESMSNMLALPRRDMTSHAAAPPDAGYYRSRYATPPPRPLGNNIITPPPSFPTGAPYLTPVENDSPGGFCVSPGELAAFRSMQEQLRQRLAEKERVSSSKSSRGRSGPI